MYCTTRYWHIFLMFLHVLYNQILTHISDVSPCTYSTRLSIRNMCQYVVVQYTTKHQKYVPVSSCTVDDETSEQLDTDTYFWFFVVYCTTRYWHIFMMLHRVMSNKVLEHIADVSSCSFYSTRWNIRYTNQYLVVEYMVTHQKYV
jgi:hypothetical protein